MTNLNCLCLLWKINIIISQNFSNRVKNGKTELDQEVINMENIKFRLNSKGKVLRKEVRIKITQVKHRIFLIKEI